MTDPIQYKEDDYDRENFIKFVKEHHGRDLEGNLVDPDFSKL